MSEDKLLSIGEAARILKKDVQTIRNWADKDKIKYIRVGSANERFFQESEVNRILEEQPN